MNQSYKVVRFPLSRASEQKPFALVGEVVGTAPGEKLAHLRPDEIETLVGLGYLKPVDASAGKTTARPAPAPEPELEQWLADDEEIIEEDDAE